MVRTVERIVNLAWEDVRLPPEGNDTDSYINAVTNVDGELVQLVDVERVLTEVIGEPEMVSSDTVANVDIREGQIRHVMVVDDSKVARSQISSALSQVGIDVTLEHDGKQALEQLKAWAAEGGRITDKQALVISDIEMPVMDDYTFTTELRADPRLAHLYVILHTSMNGVFNQSMADRVGANRFIARFDPDILAEAVISVVQEIS